MTSDEFKEAQHTLGLSDSQLGAILGVAPGTVSKYKRKTASGTYVNATAAQVMRWLLAGFRPPEWPDEPRGGKRGRPADVPR
ncbi:hypothetical protein ACEYYA_01010 [Paracoccus sp. p3-h83]|uniref:hypothetical protein n=1 Tax=Paracoccus sp. p3-h83 TaxID=3342805 RepID=UPI0035B76B28